MAQEGLVISGPEAYTREGPERPGHPLEVKFHTFFISFIGIHIFTFSPF